MHTTHEQRETALTTASDEQKFLYESHESGLKLWSIAEKNTILSPDIFAKFMQITGNVVLNLSNRTELPTLLSSELGINTEQALQITADLTDFLDQPFPSSTETADIADEIAETEAAIKSMPHIRTMAGDMSQAGGSDEKVYSTTQEAILKEAKPAVKVPVPLPRPVHPPAQTKARVPTATSKMSEGKWGG